MPLLYYFLSLMSYMYKCLTHNWSLVFGSFYEGPSINGALFMTYGGHGDEQKASFALASAESNSSIHLCL